MNASTMPSHLVGHAAHNNALWCDAVCKVHGRPGEFRDGLWLNRSGTPQYYPDAVTLAGPEAAQEQLLTISALIEKPRAEAWAVKDSFSCLDLGFLGFRLLFEAEWIGLSLPALELDPLPPGYSLTEIHLASELNVWENVWRGDESSAAGEPNGGIFRASLLTQHGIKFIAIRCDNRIVGGGILNEGGDVIGVSNVFASDVEPEIIWQGILAHAVDYFPGTTVVGYESGRDLDTALRSGFRTLGPLRVWLSACREHA
ncbi:hypothetical protein [Microvirga guangxiensis]|uniref:N-acetyltransferase domain-containing protein n=1 Tax=Microvirga guangxiensis TaxID=549386 RepID=A0A1G5KM82_9HYPH|nr:hypothetical protein [Microvirga guangxiensis]SCZ01160.1 hypothetical protein SAMN02927923_03411 [Microvirga guangxiensis]